MREEALHETIVVLRKRIADLEFELSESRRQVEELKAQAATEKMSPEKTALEKESYGTSILAPAAFVFKQAEPTERKFIQISSTENYLYALDNFGDVWQHHMTRGWVTLPKKGPHET